MYLTTKDYNREVWDTYPIYLKHTVFHESEDWDTARKMEIGHRFFIAQNLKDRANKRFKRGHYHRAISLYEKVSEAFIKNRRYLCVNGSNVR